MGRFVRADDVELRYVDEGSGTPVLLMHGFTSSLEMWHRNGVFRALVDAGYRVVAYDARAHGKSSSFREPEKYGIEVVEDARRVLDHLNIAKAHIVGYSYGSRVANKFREVHPHRFLSVTIGGFGWAASTSRAQCGILRRKPAFARTSRHYGPGRPGGCPS